MSNDGFFLRCFKSYAKGILLKSLEQSIQKGVLVIEDGEDKYKFGPLSSHLKGDEEPENPFDEGRVATIEVVNSNFWLRVYLTYDLGFSEAYMYGDFKTPDLKAILDLWLDNRMRLGSLQSYHSYFSNFLSSLNIMFFGQSLSNARLSSVTGYDCSNDFFKSFLSPDMTYSSALWPESAGGVRGDLEASYSWSENDLEVAQKNKIDHLLRKSRVRSGDRLLEFGSGWGSLAIEAANRGCTVDTITLSIEQKVYIEDKVQALGLQDQIRVHLLDYRSLPPDFEHAFDGFVAMEMIEAVGYKNLPEFFQILSWALKPDRAAAVIVATTQPEFRYTIYQATDYARRYQWPNSFCPSATSLVSTATAATKGKIVLESVENFAHHYPRTLREWGLRLQNNWNDENIALLIKSQPHLAEEGNLDIFKRKWEYMYIYAEVGYARAYTSLHFFTFVRPENVAQKCD
ncbi:CFS1-like protein [Marasmius fiardii PR-910]|nr:CFS1-like protein [Marasmius fiardii PR-910]